MKDVLLINFFSKNESGYTEYYISKLKEKNLSFDSVYFERYNQDTVALDNEVLFKEYCPTGGSKIKKIGTMLRYCKLVRKLVNPSKYRSVIVFTTVPSIMIMDLLISKFSGRYILDIRDYTHESIPLYRRMEKMLVEHSFKTIISSRGFLQFLPSSDKYVITHNIGKDFHEANQAKQMPSDRLNIGYVGSVRYFEENKRIINQLRNQEEYQLLYYGTMTTGCNLEDYCKEHEVRNVTFYGRYDNDKKDQIYQNIDIINSIYGTDSLETTTLTPNRLYDAALYKLPIIASKGSFLAELIYKYHLGFAVDLATEDLGEKIKEYAQNFSASEFTESCKLFLQDVKTDMLEQERALNDFINVTL